MKILVNDLKRQTASARGEILAAITAIVDSGWFVLGKSCTTFEQQFAAYCGARHCVGVANGTDALELALRGLGIGAGHRVAIVANAGFYAATALLAIGASPVFVDVDADTHLMNPDRLREVAGEVNAVIVTHLFGLMADMSTIMRVAGDAGIAVIEDCAQAHGAERDGRRAGSVGHAAAFSFYPTKNLGALGDGGAVVTSDAAIAARVTCLRQYGWTSKYRTGEHGGRNSRLDELQGAILLAKLPRLDGWNGRRREIAGQYSGRISNRRVRCPPVRGGEYIAHLYVVTCDDRASLRQHLEAAGIATDIHYPLPDHRQLALRPDGSLPPLPVTEALAEKVLTLPCFAELTDSEVDFVIERINCW